MKNKKILKIGTIVSTVIPLAVVISCGNSKEDKEEKY